MEKHTAERQFVELKFRMDYDRISNIATTLGS